MSDTPRTDALLGEHSEFFGVQMVSAEHSRQIERELNEAKTRIEVLEGALRPFATLLQSHHDSMRPEQPIFGINSVTITKKHLIDARTALEKS